MPRRTYTTDTRQFARIQDVVAHLPAPGQLRGQYNDGHKPPAAPAARPSTQLRQYQGRAFTFGYPSNWQMFGDPQSAMATVAPSDGVVQDRNGKNAIGSVGVVRYYLPEVGVVE